MVALVATASMIMLITLGTVIGANLERYALLAREIAESGTEFLELELEDSSLVIDRGDAYAIALIYICRDKVSIVSLDSPIHLSSGYRMVLEELKGYSAVEEELEAVCVVTDKLNLFCSPPINSTATPSEIQELMDEMEELEDLASGGVYAALLAKMLSTSDYLSIVNNYIPIGYSEAVYEWWLRYLGIAASFRISDDGDRVYYTVSICYRFWHDCQKFSGEIATGCGFSKSVKLGNYSKKIRYGDTLLLTNIEVYYRIIRPDCSYILFLLPSVYVSYTTKPAINGLKIVQFFEPKHYTFMTRIYSRYSGAPGVFASLDIAYRDDPPVYIEIVSKPSTRATEDGTYIYTQPLNSVEFRYRFYVDDAYRWSYCKFRAGEETYQTMGIYIPMPYDYNPFKSIVVLVKPWG